jgi:hypothetical protein
MELTSLSEPYIKNDEFLASAHAQLLHLRPPHYVRLQALELDPSLGRHLLLSNRAAVRLVMGEAEGALEDANAAVGCAPPGYTTAYVRQVGLQAAASGSVW